MPHRVHYRSLANCLQGLDLSATCADLLARLSGFRANDAAWWEGVLAAIGRMPPEAEWMHGLLRLCELLKEENERFESAILMEWVLEER